ncbi:hypothetical protein [Methylosinus sp. Sm6]|uniref:hypothetical protein n=1 Tax=Methylosinus sp. Sm6 TaxID=2866948 RepID=UPI001C99C980|nr:hypothetical protein [Methylosinus sp. Sm6]MBY6240268.1 hypothetical protein [Methylosinus sp. Sm6]
MRLTIHRLAILFMIGMMLGVVAPMSATAGSLLTAPFSRSTANNGGALSLGGTYQFDEFTQADPWVAQVYASPSECLRIDVYSQDTDLEAVLVSPSGTVWRNDDRNGSSDRRPLLKVVTTVATGIGWHVLQISRFDGKGPGANFKFYYGRYPAGNPNCASPTSPSSVNAVAASKE